ncbi:hypothetical protein [uncultured Lacinutrix sp.]|uniref:hypothetical protein n=1 Tax=uncultured Lacinutrix sp. TaxID=574032 RepID=UPI0026142B83|nr:hypothetical protein [uncultured Lacinutrix sp.]
MNFTKSKERQQIIRIINVKKGVSLAILFAFISTLSLNAQSTPEPPTPPSTSTGVSYSISVDNDDNRTSNSSVSVSITEDTYKFRASFHKTKNKGVKTMLFKALGEKNLSVNGNTYLWTNNQNSDEIFECKLTNGRLRMHVDLNYASKEFSKKINALGNDLKYYISGRDRKKEEAKKTERAMRDLERAEKELERAKRDLERAKRNN